jgi:hypothetical protein
MRIHFEITDHDVEEALAFYKRWEHSRLVRDRYRRNVLGQHPALDPKQIWWALTLGLLTTQQRSDADAPVSRVLNSDPYLLALSDCQKAPSCEALVHSRLRAFGGIRRSTIISSQLHRNLTALEDGRWNVLLPLLHSLERHPGRDRERAAAQQMQDWFVGLGPKQSRNVLQVLGLTQHEIPLDSRLVRWLKGYGFPLTTKALADPAAYTFVEDGFQALCQRIDVLPCLMDAAIFASYDPKGWGALETEQDREKSSTQKASS